MKTVKFGVKALVQHISTYEDYTVRHCCLSMFVISAEEVEVGDKEGQDCFSFIRQKTNS